MKTPLLGFDLVRLLAIGMVAAQHAITISGRESMILFGGMDIGRMGVALFCALSGYLAFGRSSKPPLAWLMARFVRVYPAYWLFLIVAFAANAVVGYKPVNVEAMLSQVVGIGYLTHPSAIIGTHTWFITLILGCFVLAALMRSAGWPAMVGTLIFCTVLSLVWERYDGMFLGHILAFLSGCLLAQIRPVGVWGMGLMFLAASGVAFGLPVLTAPFIGVTGILLARLLTVPSPLIVARLSRGTYEFFLMHALAFQLMNKLFPGNPVALFLVGSLLTIPAAWLLQIAAEHIVRRLERLPTCCVTPRMPVKV